MSRYQAYPEYKESNIGWMGAVPEGWNVIPCRAVVEDIAEKNVGAVDQNYLSVMANVGVIKYEDKGDVGNKKPDDLSKCKIVKAGNLVINSMNYAIGSYGMSPYNGVCSPVYIVLGVNEEAMESRFALRIFENTPFQKYLATFGNGILEHRAAIGWDDIKGAHIPVPSKAEQRAILNFLDYETAKIDALIEKQQRLIELLKEKRQAVISHAVTKGLNPDAPMKNSGVEWLGEVPAHWALLRVKFVCSFTTSGPRGWSEQVGETGSLFIQSGDLSDTLLVNFSGSKRVQIGNDAEAKRTALRNGDIVVCITGAKTGNVGLCDVVPEDAYINQHLCLIRPTSIIASAFLAVQLKSSLGQTYFELSQYGLKQGLSLENVREAPVLVPPVTEQSAIVSYLNVEAEKFDVLSAKAQHSKELLQERRTALISAAVTGKIDVRDWQAAA